MDDFKRIEEKLRKALHGPISKKELDSHLERINSSGIDMIVPKAPKKPLAERLREELGLV